MLCRDAVEALEGQIDPETTGEGDEVQDGVRGAGDGGEHRHGVLQGLPGENRRWAQSLAGDLDGPAPSFLGEGSAARVGGRYRRRSR